jgi:hypothetical protein
MVHLLISWLLQLLPDVLQTIASLSPEQVVAWRLSSKDDTEESIAIGARIATRRMNREKDLILLRSSRIFVMPAVR